MISKEFVPYELCIALREIGFDEKCIASRIEEYDWFIEFSYDPVTNSMIDKLTKELEEEREEGDEPIKDVVAAPLYSQAFRWFRDEHGLHGEPIWDNDGKIYWFFSITKIGNVDFLEGRHKYETPLTEDQNFHDGYPVVLKWRESFEEAELACLKKLIEIVRNEKQK